MHADFGSGLWDGGPIGIPYVDISALPRQARVVATALKRYGLIVADNGSDWFVSGAPHPRWDNDQLHALDRLTGRDFEIVDTSGLRPR